MVGVDAMTFDAIGPLCERGMLPSFAGIIAEGCHGRLRTIRPTNSGLIWTSIATGRDYREHGISGLECYDLLGLRLTRITTRKIGKIGLKGVLKVLRRCRLMRRHPFDSRDVRVKTLWDIVGESGGRVGIVNWLNTWPAHPVNGFLASDRLQAWRLARLGVEEPKNSRLTFPKSLLYDVQSLLVPPEKVPFEVLKGYVSMPDNELEALVGGKFDKWTIGTELQYSVSSDLSAWRVFEYCVDAFGPLNLAAVFFWGMDKVQHAAFRYMPFVNRQAVTEEERRKFGRIVPESYAFIDRAIGRIIARMGPEDALFVISDHGFDFEPKRGTYGHKRAGPPGVFFAYGRKLRTGYELDGASVYDVLPTILRLCGLPPAGDMIGRCLEEILAPWFRSQHPPLEPIETYEARGPDHNALR